MLINANRATALMAADGVDAIISATIDNNFYLTGIYVDSQYLFPYDSEFYAVAAASRPEAGIVVCSIGAADQTLQSHPTVTDVVSSAAFSASSANCFGVVGRSFGRASCFLPLSPEPSSLALTTWKV